MINPKVRAAALDFLKSQNPSQLEGQALHDAYEAECKLFNEHFKGMTKSELNDYSGFVQWLDNSGMSKADLTIDELHKWQRGKSLTLAYSRAEGAMLIDPVTKKTVRLLNMNSDHPIDGYLKQE